MNNHMKLSLQNKYNSFHNILLQKRISPMCALCNDKMERFATIVNGFQLLAIVAKLFIWDASGVPGSVHFDLYWGQIISALQSYFKNFYIIGFCHIEGSSPNYANN